MKTSDTHDSGWLGWIGFASFMLMLGGMFSLLAGFVALFKDTAVYVASSATLWTMSYDQWGWAHILAGTLALLAAASLLAGNMFGRVFAIIVALASALVNMAFIPVYPFWALLVIFIDVMVIFAVVVHGSELKEDMQLHSHTN